MEWLAPLTSVTAGVVVLVLTYLGARRLGLTDLQKAVSTETELLVSRLRERVVLLEKENGELKAEVSRLKGLEQSLRERVDALEALLADRSIAKRRANA